ncbi:hypothetical protein EAO77_23215 [Streptomyces sp. t39]|nr:hypothetical protein EAO77_23215 [Streptomyces sp. t39]
MPSLTVVFSSDTDICFSPGLYGDCLPTIATGVAADSFRSRGLSLFHARTPAGRGVPARRGGGASHRRYGRRQSDVNRL